MKITKVPAPGGLNGLVDTPDSTDEKLERAPAMEPEIAGSSLNSRRSS
jgi:hypothetical protein